MAISTESAIKNFGRRRIKGIRSCNVYYNTMGDRDNNYETIAGHILYSYGSHFPLAVTNKDGNFGCDISYIINADKYSVSTSRHQNLAIRNLKPNVQIPFSALYEAYEWANKQVNPEHSPYRYRTSEVVADWLTNPGKAIRIDAPGSIFLIVDYALDKWVEIPDPKPDDPDHTRTVHSLGGVLFTITFPDSNQVFTFLSSFDEIDTRNYFLCHVPGTPLFIDEAYQALKPQEVIEAEKCGREVLRQGDWFFIATIDEDKQFIQNPEAKTTEEKKFTLIAENSDTGTHYVTRTRRTPDTYPTLYPPVHTIRRVVSGCVRHTRGEHRLLKLGDGKQWYVPVHNTSLGGWSAAGNVD